MKIHKKFMKNQRPKQKNSIRYVNLVYDQMMGSLQNLFDNTIKEIQKSTFFQINCILQTFSQTKIEEIEQLFLSPDPNNQDVKNAIQMINFLQFQGVEDCDTVKNVCDITLQKMTKTIQKTYQKIEKIFQKMTKNIKQNDFISEMKKYKYSLEFQGRIRMQGTQQIRQKGQLEKEDQRLSDAEIPQQSLVHQIKKQAIETEKIVRSQTIGNSLKSQIKQTNEKLTFLNKFKAFFQEQEDQSQLKEKIKKDKNLILVKKEH